MHFAKNIMTFLDTVLDPEKLKQQLLQSHCLSFLKSHADYFPLPSLHEL